MRRFLLAAPGYTGDAELIYNETGKLIRIDISKTNMAAGVMEEFKQRAPVNVADLDKAFEGVKLTMQEVGFEISFEQFWKKYDKKINKVRCVALWNKLSAGDRLKAYLGIDKYNAYLRKEGWRTKLDPENYLRNRAWENEYK